MAARLGWNTQTGSDITLKCWCAADGCCELQLRGVGSLRQPSGPPGGEVSGSVSQQCRTHIPVCPSNNHLLHHEDQDPEGTDAPERTVSFVHCHFSVSLTSLSVPQILTDTSLQKVKRNQNCLEPCVRQLVSCLESDMVRTQSQNRAASFPSSSSSLRLFLHQRSLLLLLADTGGGSSLRCFHPVQRRHSGPAGISSSHQHIRLLSGNKPRWAAVMLSSSVQTDDEEENDPSEQLDLSVFSRMPTSRSLAPPALVSVAPAVWFTSPGRSRCTALLRPLSPHPGKIPSLLPKVV